MKKVIVLLVVLLGAFATFTFAQHTTNKSSQNIAGTAKTKYTCPMHPEIISTKPGKCPKCGMTLVKQKIKNKQKKVMKQGTYIKPKD